MGRPCPKDRSPSLSPPSATASASRCRASKPPSPKRSCGHWRPMSALWRFPPAGAFAFTDVDIAPGRIFVVTTEYQGAIYGSQAAHVSGEDLSLDVPLTIYDSTSDASQLRVDRLHLLFDFPGPDLIRVVELWILSNLGDRTVTPQEADGVVKIVLPEGASNLRFEEGEVGGGFQA